MPPRELDQAPRGGSGTPKATAVVLQLRDLLLEAVGAIAEKADMHLLLGHLLDEPLRAIPLHCIRRRNLRRLRWVRRRLAVGKVLGTVTGKGSALPTRQGQSD